jgi:hypothetical protein
MSLRTILLAACFTTIVAGVPAANAESIAFKADLKGSSEVPPNDSAGTGTVEATFDTDSKAFVWTIDYSGLTGDATAAHFHGPAAPDATAGPVVPIEGSLASPIKGEATLDDQQATDLQAGMWYFNVHTAQYPDGELRGQVLKQ